MSEQANVRTVEAIYAAFGRGDLGAVLTTLDEDVAWRHPRPDDIPWGGERHGRDAVAEFFIATNRYLEVEEFTPEQFVARDNQVIVFGTSACGPSRRPGLRDRLGARVHDAGRHDRRLPRIHRHGHDRRGAAPAGTALTRLYRDVTGCGRKDKVS